MLYVCTFVYKKIWPKGQTNSYKFARHLIDIHDPCNDKIILKSVIHNSFISEIDVRGLKCLETKNSSWKKRIY